jgi:hypothetical protein
MTFEQHIRALDLHDFESAAGMLEVRHVALECYEGSWTCVVIGTGGVTVVSEQGHAGEAVRLALRRQRRRSRR